MKISAQGIPPANEEHAVQRLSTAMDTSGDAIIGMSLDGIIQSWNNAAERIFGYTAGEVVGKSILTLVPADRHHEENEILATAHRGERIEQYETLRRRKDGTLIDVSVTVSPLFDEQGKVVGASKIARDVGERRRIDSMARHFAAIVESSEDTIISKNLNGIIQSWNKAAERMFGYKAEEIIGRPVLTLIPEERHHEEVEILSRIRRGDRIEHFETVRRRKDGSEVHISLTVSPVKDENGTIIGASKIARDITAQKEAERLLQQQTRRLETLNRVAKEISRDLDLDRIVQAVTSIATEVTGARFGAFFYNVLDERGESYLLYALSGAPREAFERFGMPRNTAIFNPTFRGEGVVRSDDIRKDPRYGKSAPHHGMPKGHLPVVSYLAVPVVSARGDVHGGLFFGHDEPGVFMEDTETLVSAIAAQAAVAMDNARLHRAAQGEIEQRKRAEAARELLLHEIKHRVKNTLGTVQAMAAQTFRGAPRAEKDAFVARLQALSEAHDLLTQRNWETVTTTEIIERAVAPFRVGRADRISVSGPSVELSPNKALLVALLLHELGTNAVKYGALSNLKGSVSLTWLEEERSGHRCLELLWREKDGPVVMEPKRRGFGTQMIERALQAEKGKAEFAFEPTGLQAHLWIVY
ncbi:MAG: PAS domain S-box protein [Alphaproteobacteria bacterium]|nr:PAS domain S-box protein [Alphaproteobacteria bacterium]